MTTRALLLTCLLTGAVGAALACQAARDVEQEFVDQLQVRRAVQARVGSSAVDVTLLNGTTLKLTLPNSPLRQLPKAQKDAKAAELAKVAYDTYGGRDSITHVAVLFSSDLNLLFLHVSSGGEVYTFDTARWR